MNCPSRSGNGGPGGAALILFEYADGSLDPVQSSMLAKHIDECPECARVVQGHDAVWDVLDAWQPPAVAADFNRRLWNRIDAWESAPWYRQIADIFRFGSLKPALPVAAAALVIAAGFLLDHPGRRVASPPAGISATEADQAERTLDDLQLLRQLDTAVAPAPAKSM